MTRRGHLISVAIFTIPIALGGCALPIAVSVASYTFDAFSYAVEGKSVSDLAISNVVGEDCSVLRAVGGNAVCHDYSPEEQRARDRFVAEAKTFDRRANSVSEPTGSYAPAGQTDRESAVLLAANDRGGDAAGKTADGGVVRAIASPDLGISGGALSLPAVDTRAGTIEAPERIEAAANRTTDSSTAVGMLTMDEPQRATALPPLAQALPAIADVSTVAVKTKPTQVASAIGADAAPKSNAPVPPSLAPRLGLELDTMLLTELSN
jgi:hypothetical protein